MSPFNGMVNIIRRTPTRSRSRRSPRARRTPPQPPPPPVERLPGRGPPTNPTPGALAPAVAAAADKEAVTGSPTTDAAQPPWPGNNRTGRVHPCQRQPRQATCPSHPLHSQCGPGHPNPSESPSQPPSPAGCPLGSLIGSE
jgi:hypothetical protein